MVLVPKERACSKLHYGYKPTNRTLCFVHFIKGKRSVFKLGTNPVKTYQKIKLIVNLPCSLCGRLCSLCSLWRGTVLWRCANFFSSLARSVDNDHALENPLTKFKTNHSTGKSSHLQNMRGDVSLIKMCVEGSGVKHVSFQFFISVYHWATCFSLSFSFILSYLSFLGFFSVSFILSLTFLRLYIVELVDLKMLDFGELTIKYKDWR